MLAEQLDYMIGVDPHRDLHALAVFDVISGAVVFETSVAADSGGYAAALKLVRQHTWVSARSRSPSARLRRGSRRGVHRDRR